MFHLNLQSKFLFFIPFLYSSYETGWFKDREIFSYFKKKKKKKPNMRVEGGNLQCMCFDFQIFCTHFDDVFVHVLGMLHALQGV